MTKELKFEQGQTQKELKIYNGRPDSMDGRKRAEVDSYDLLDRCGVEYVTVCHEAVFTMEACRDVEEVLGVTIFKNLFLCNRQQTEFYLLMLPADKAFKTKELSETLRCSRLSFARPEQMTSLLGIEPGAVSPLGLMNDKEGMVRLVVDNDLLAYKSVGCHPCVNTSTVRLSLNDLLQKIIPFTGHPATFVNLHNNATEYNHPRQATS